MSKFTHTPGPWVLSDRDEIGPIIKDDEKSFGMFSSVAELLNGRVADALLIAAAPELLEALQAITHSLEFEDLRHDDQRDAFKKAIAAIAKATGEA